MRSGSLLLVDEISLAEDSVLERLNSVLETGRSLSLAERGGAAMETVRAAPGWLLLATMNPGCGPPRDPGPEGPLGLCESGSAQSWDEYHFPIAVLIEICGSKSQPLRSSERCAPSLHDCKRPSTQRKWRDIKPNLRTQR